MYIILQGSTFPPGGVVFFTIVSLNTLAFVLGEVKAEDGQMHVHAILCSRKYVRSSSVGPMDALTVEPPYVDMMATSSVTVTETLFLVPKSILSFNLKENGFMKILGASKSLNGISTLKY